VHETAVTRFGAKWILVQEIVLLSDMLSLLRKLNKCGVWFFVFSKLPLISNFLDVKPMLWRVPCVNC